MKKIYILSVLALAITSCTNYFDEKQLGNVDYQPSDVRTGMTYTLTDDDYAAVASNAENIAKALAIDSAAYRELLAIATDKAFTETASADMYAAAVLANKFPYLDNGTMCDLMYRLHEGKTNRVLPFTSSTGYTLVEDDYRSIWNGRGADYLTPTSETNIAAFLSSKFATADNGKIVVLTYKYMTAEPDTIYAPLDYICTVSQLLEARETVEHQLTGKVGQVKSSLSGRFYLVDDNGMDSIYVYGLNDEDGNKVWKDKGIAEGDRITIKGKYSEESGSPQIVNGIYVSHVSGGTPSPMRRVAAAVQDTLVKSVIYQLQNGEWSLYSNDQLAVAEALPQSIYSACGAASISDPETVIGTYLRQTYPYAQADQIYLIAYRGASGMTADEWVYDGSNFVMATGYVMETMSFEVKENKWIANISTYLQSIFKGEGPGKWTMQTVTLDGLSYIWRYQASYGMTASSYVSSVNHRVEGWLVSPNIRLKKSVQPQLTFDQAVRYGNTTDNPTWLNVMLTTNFTGDVTTTEWTKLEFPAELPDGSNWTFQTSGIFDLSEYNGQTIVIAFRYKTDFEGVEVPSAPTWEIQNLLVAEPAEEEVAE